MNFENDVCFYDFGKPVTILSVCGIATSFSPCNSFGNANFNIVYGFNRNSNYVANGVDIPARITYFEDELRG